jgi:beta-lactamase class D
MNILSTAEALEALNKRLQRPMSRALFHQSVVPALLSSGYAKSLGTATAIDGEAWSGWWVGYIALREQKIAAGEWLSNRPYSAEDAEDFRDGHYDTPA